MISIKNLMKSYDDFPVLKGINLEIPKGQFLVILGPSGVGKSTLLRCINRLTTPNSGDLIVGNNDATNPRAIRALRKEVAMIFQQHNVVGRLSVLKNVLTGRLGNISTLSSILQFFTQKDKRIAVDCLERVDLTHKAEERADALSGGQRQRVGIARALAQQPKVILADEPVASLDPKTSRMVLNYLKSAANELGITVICNLHQVDYAKEFGDRIVGICDGRISFDGTGDMLTDDILHTIYHTAPQQVKKTKKNRETLKSVSIPSFQEEY